MPSLYAVMSEEKSRQSERIRKLQEENEELKALIKALKKSNADFINQIKKAYDEDLSVKELAYNCGIEIKGD